MQQNENTRILFVLLLIASFFLGSLITKVSYLEKGGSTATTAQTPPEGNTKPTAKPDPITDKDHIRGNKDAKVTLLEYSDFECPYCQRFHPVTQELLKTYGDKIRLVYRHFPLSFHANAQKEAEASECIAELGGNDAFWNYVDTIFERTTANGTGFALDKLGPLAAELGVNQEKFQSCLDSGKYEKLVKDQMANGEDAGVSGTPSTFVIDKNGDIQLVVGAEKVEKFSALIDAALK